MGTEQQKRLKVLCLHGYRQNGQIFREKSGALRKALKGRVDFEFVSAPLLINLPSSTQSEVTEQNNGEKDARAWWFSNREWRTFSSKETTEIADGFGESMEMVVTFLREKGPFDGLLGFSQGASFIQLLLASNADVNFQFVILFSGFKSLSNLHRPLIVKRIPTPSFHAWGLTDEIVLPNRSEELAEMFDNPSIAIHPGKHCIPSMKNIRDQLNSFMDQFEKIEKSSD